MLKENKAFLFNCLKALILIVLNVFAFCYIKNKSIIFYLFLIITDIIIFLSFYDTAIIFKNKKKDNIYKYYGVTLIILDIIIILTFLIFIIIGDVVVNSLYFLLIYDSIIFILYLLLLIIYKVIIKNSSTSQNKIDSNHMYFKLLKNEVLSIKEHKNFPNELNDYINEIINFISYEMTLTANGNSFIYEQQIARCLTLCNELLDENNIDDLNKVLIEMFQILKKREKELKNFE